MYRVVLVLLLFSVCCTGARAEVLQLDALLTSSSRHVPAIQAAMAKRDATAQAAVTARGAFDLQVGSEAFSRASGFYDGISVLGKAEQPIRDFGANVYGQYRISSGDFPIYEDVNFTNLGGQAKVGVVLSLLKDRDIDERRFALTDADLAIEGADFDVLISQISVQQSAAAAYWRWVAAGRRLAVFRDLLAIAEERDVGLRKEVESGARARFFLIENQQTITQRRGLVTAANRDYQLAANQLAMFWRDDEGVPTVPDASMLPPDLTSDRDAPLRALEGIAQTLAGRPDLARLQNTIQRAAARIQLQQNNLRPQLDVRLEVAEGLGGVGEGGVSRDSTDTIVAVNFSVPIQRRAAKGRLAAAEARLDALQLERQQLEEQIDLELKGIMLSLRYAEQLAALASLEVDQSEQLQRAEQIRFRNGASDFFLVNVRETAVANARVKEISARLQTRIAETNFDAATINITNLGL
ncbi:MAG: TolC family protein [Pseudomonadota bacterium]